jgi:hypothetical protein
MIPALETWVSDTKSQRSAVLASSGGPATPDPRHNTAPAESSSIVSADAELIYHPLCGSVIRRAYIDACHPGGGVDVVVVTADCALTLRWCRSRWSAADPWRESMSYDECQARLVGATIVDVHVSGLGRAMTLMLGDGTSLSGDPTWLEAVGPRFRRRRDLQAGRLRP